MQKQWICIAKMRPRLCFNSQMGKWLKKHYLIQHIVWDSGGQGDRETKHTWSGPLDYVWPALKLGGCCKTKFWGAL